MGIVVAIAGVALYALRSVRPELARDHDIFFSALALVYGAVLLFYSWKYDPLMQFSEIIVGGSAIFFAFENVRLRGITTEQAKRNTTIVDDDRPVSQVYRAELDDFSTIETRPPTRRIRGSQDPRSTRTDDYYDGESRPRSRRRGSSGRLGSGDQPGDQPRKRRPRPENRPPTTRPSGYRSDGGYGEYGADDYWGDSYDERGGRPPTRTRQSPPRDRGGSVPPDDVRPPRRKRRPPQRDEGMQGPPPAVEEPPVDRTPPPDEDYVDYQPIDYPEDETDEDNSGNFDY